MRLAPSRGYYATPDPTLGPTGRFFDGNAESQVGLQAGLRRDIWTAVQPDIGAMQSMIDGIDHRFPLASGATERFLLAAIAERYRRFPPPASFRMILSPMVEWIWLGGLILAGGALIAIWPTARPATLRVRAAYRAPLRGEPERA